MRQRRALRAAGIVIAMAMTLAGVSIALAETIDLPVPRTTIYPGDIISDDQLADRAFLAHTVTRASVFTDREVLVGKVARRTLLPGQPVPVNGIREPYLVNQGKSSLVVFRNGGLTITAQAIALQNGSVGDVVTLRNPDSGSVIRGTVAPDGTVQLGAQ